MILAAVAYMAGLFFASFFTGISSLLFLLPAAAAVFFIGSYRGMVRCDFIIAGACFIAAAAVFGLYTSLNYDRVTAYDGKTGSFRGTVVSVSDYNGGKSVYTLRGRIDGSRSAKLRLYTDSLDVRYGDIVKIENCTFSIPRGDYLYDPENRLRSEGVFLEAEYPDGISAEKSSGHGLMRRIIAYRERMCREFRSEMGDEAGSFIAGMVFGHSSELDSDVRTSFARCGIAHILAVSGLHVSIAALLFMELLKMLRVNRFAAFGAMNVFLLMLILLADSPISAVRAAIMMDMVYAAGLFRRQNDTFTSLSAAALLICITNPYVIYNAGFLLSVAGTFGIGVCAPYMTKGLREKGLLWGVLSAFLTMLCTSLCILPLSMKFFDETSLISPLSNLLIIPFCGVILVIGMLYVFTGGAVSLLAPAKYVAEAILSLTDRISHSGRICFSAGSDRVIELAFVLAAAVAAVQFIARSRGATAYAAVFSCTVLFLGSAFSSRSFYRSFNAAVLGKGSNAAVVLTFSGRTDVIDLSGSSSSPDYVRKYLARNNISRPDVLVLTQNVQAQYSAYRSAFDGNAAEECYAAGDTPVYGSEDTEIYGNIGYVYSADDYTVAYENGVLTVKYGGASVSFSDAASRAENMEGLRVYYGNSAAEAVKDEETVYVADCGNCFVIRLSDDGGHRIRRL